MSAKDFNRIVQIGTGRQVEYPLKASVDITPGQLLEINAGTVTFKDTAADVDAYSLYAIEGKFRETADGVKDIDTDYAVDGEQVICYYPRPGDYLFAWLDDGESVAADALLEAAANGSLQAKTTGRAIARATETIDNSVGGAPVRIYVEVIK